jgi:hypothetical protein
MKCFNFLYQEATYLPSLLSFGGDAIIQDQPFPSDQTTAPSETKLIIMKNALLRVFINQA